MSSADAGGRWVRSALFIPAQRTDFLAKATTRGADAVILDLEDAVSAPGKASAREGAREWLRTLPDDGPLAMVRVNGLETSAFGGDLEAVVGPGLHAVLLPKVRDADDVRALADRLSWLEGRSGIPHGRIRIWPIIETAQAVESVGEIARSSQRIAYMGGGSSEQGDLAREIGFEWSVDGLESLYIRSRVLVAARAAGVPNPITGLVSGLADLDDVETFALGARRLGYSGMMVIHPRHVPVVHRIFTPTAAELDDARRIMVALDAAAGSGTGAVAHDGRMIDVAMARTAAQYLERAGGLPTHGERTS